MINGKIRNVLFGALVAAGAWTANAVEKPRVTLGGYIGERFETCLRGNVLRLRWGTTP